MSSPQGKDRVVLPRLTKGPRPYFFDDPAVDQMMTFILELVTEVMVLRDRQDSLERLLDERGAISRDDLRNTISRADIEADRVADRMAFVERVLRIHVPQGRDDDPSVR